MSRDRSKWTFLCESFNDSPKFRAGLNRAQMRQLQGTFAALLVESNRSGYSGALLDDQFRQITGRRDSWAERMLRREVNGKAPLVHHVDDGAQCTCLAGRDFGPDAQWIIHDYLDYNLAAEEAKVHKEKKVERPAYRNAVLDRDGHRCRYCHCRVHSRDRRSDRRPHIDHVDPATAAGMANLVTACDSCNRHKGARTLKEAGMKLLPPPEATQDEPDPYFDLEADDHGIVRSEYDEADYIRAEIEKSESAGEPVMTWQHIDTIRCTWEETRCTPIGGEGQNATETQRGRPGREVRMLTHNPSYRRLSQPGPLRRPPTRRHNTESDPGRRSRTPITTANRQPAEPAHAPNPSRTTNLGET